MRLSPASRAQITFVIRYLGLAPQALFCRPLRGLGVQTWICIADYVARFAGSASKPGVCIKDYVARFAGSASKPGSALRTMLPRFAGSASKPGICIKDYVARFADFTLPFPVSRSTGTG